jgi:hypothetical protein
VVEKRKQERARYYSFQQNIVSIALIPVRVLHVELEEMFETFYLLLMFYLMWRWQIWDFFCPKHLLISNDSMVLL